MDGSCESPALEHHRTPLKEPKDIDQMEDFWATLRSFNLSFDFSSWQTPPIEI